MESPSSGVTDQGPEKDGLLDGTSIVKAGTESNIKSLLYEAIENLFDGNSEVSQSVSFDTMEERREGRVEGEPRDSFPSSLYWASSSIVLDRSTGGCCSTIQTCEIACSCKSFSSLSEETLTDASKLATRWTEGGEKTGEGKECMGGAREDSSENSGGVLEDMSPSLSPS